MNAFFITNNQATYLNLEPDDYAKYIDGNVQTCPKFYGTEYIAYIDEDGWLKYREANVVASGILRPLGFATEFSLVPYNIAGPVIVTRSDHTPFTKEDRHLIARIEKMTMSGGVCTSADCFNPLDKTDDECTDCCLMICSICHRSGKRQCRNHLE